MADFARENITAWKIDDRVTIEHIDVREYESDKKFDTITFFNLIYYFPVIERIELLGRLGNLLNDDGQLIMTTLCPGNDPSIQLMNLWASMTNGCGPLPHPDNVIDQLKNAGFKAIEVKSLIPAFYLFKAKK